MEVIGNSALLGLLKNIGPFVDVFFCKIQRVKPQGHEEKTVFLFEFGSGLTHTVHGQESRLQERIPTEWRPGCGLFSSSDFGKCVVAGVPYSIFVFNIYIYFFFSFQSRSP